MADASMEERLVFLIAPPRSGSTLLMRVLHATDTIWSRPEPHLMGPLAHLGFYDNVDRAPFDHLQAADAVKAFVADLPRGEDDYLDALRAYADVMYGRMLATAPGHPRYFLDKTPANALVLPFLAKLYPRARFLVLTRHPAAIFASYAESFFDGDYEAAAAFNPILSRYVPAIARFLRRTDVPLLHVRYEDLVSAPEATLGQISAWLDIPYDADALNYGRREVAAGLGDPVGVKRHERPVASSKDTWGAELAASEARFQVVARQVAACDAEDLALWGTPLASFWKPMEEADPSARTNRAVAFDSFQAQRRGLRWARRMVRESAAVSGALTQARRVTDVLLRDGFADYADAARRPRTAGDEDV